MINKLLGITKTIFRYKKPDLSKRRIVGVHGEGGSKGGHIVTNPNGLYNQNLTVGELSLLRTFIWEYKDIAKDSWEYRRFLDFIHGWMFTENKEPVLHLDIVQDIEEGVRFEGKLP